VMGKPFPGLLSHENHPWTKDMRDCDAEMMVGQKAAQMGYTEVALDKSFKAIDIDGISVMYILPASNPDASDFSTARFSGFDWQKMLIPYGVLLFAYLGTAAIPEMREELRDKPGLMKRAIIWGSVIPMIFYAVFTMAAIGISGNATTEVATIGLAILIDGHFTLLLHVFAILAMSTSFVAMGYAVKQSYEADYGMGHGNAWFLTMVVPVVLLLFADSFVRTLDFAGTFAGGIAGIAVVLMHAKAKKMSGRRPEYSIKMNRFGYGTLIALFAVGMLYQLFLLV